VNENATVSKLKWKMFLVSLYMLRFFAVLLPNSLSVFCDHQVLRSNSDLYTAVKAEVGIFFVSVRNSLTKHTVQSSCEGRRQTLSDFDRSSKAGLVLSLSWLSENINTQEFQNFSKLGTLTGYCGISPRGSQASLN
jgi:hypothetical protein